MTPPIPPPTTVASGRSPRMACFSRQNEYSIQYTAPSAPGRMEENAMASDRFALPDGTHTVAMGVGDLNGIMRGKRIPADQWPRVCESGAALSIALFAIDMTSDVWETPYVSMDNGYPDMHIVPAGSVHAGPGRKAAPSASAARSVRTIYRSRSVPAVRWRGRLPAWRRWGSRSRSGPSSSSTC